MKADLPKDPEDIFAPSCDVEEDGRDDRRSGLFMSVPCIALGDSTDGGLKVLCPESGPLVEGCDISNDRCGVIIDGSATGL